MLTLEHVSELAGTMVANDIGLLEVKGANYSVRLVRAPGAALKGDASGPTSAAIHALAPATGSFHPRGLDDGLLMLKTGAQVLIKEPLGYIGIGPLRVPCLSPVAGRIIGALPTQQKTVACSEPLFVVEPSP